VLQQREAVADDVGVVNVVGDEDDADAACDVAGASQQAGYEARRCDPGGREDG
jgi:hypothetical protein